MRTRQGSTGSGSGGFPTRGFRLLIDRGGSRMPMASAALIVGLARDESLTRGLGDVEAQALVHWATDWAELLADAARSEIDAERLVARLLRRAKAIARFVQLWFVPRGKPAAIQLAASERFEWPLPDEDDQLNPCELMEHILNWENQHRGD